MNTMAPFNGFDDGNRTQLLEAVAEMGPSLMRAAVESDRARKLTDSSMRRLSDAGLLRLAAPRRLGGQGASTTLTAEIARLLAHYCPSASWLYCVSNTNCWEVSQMPAAVSEEVFQDGVPVVCGSTIPGGESRRSADGLRVSGRWPYSSGCDHAQWGVFSLRDLDEGGKLAGAQVVVRMKSASIADTWFTTGLRGTGSSTVVLENQLVPDHHRVIGGRAELAREATDQIVLAPYFRSLLLGTALGTAEALRDKVVPAVCERRIAHTSYVRGTDSSALQMRIGEAVAVLDTVGLLLREAAAAVDACACAGGTMPYAEQARHRGMTSHAVALLGQGVAGLMEAAGSTGYQEGVGIEKLWRDVSIACSHAINVPRVGYEVYGRSLMAVDRADSPWGGPV
jgi:3-hydroxy-9,10-secoandrosta-1,3,5(10)-triene-9,17-dione monooxygenase